MRLREAIHPSTVSAFPALLDPASCVMGAEPAHTRLQAAALRASSVPLESIPKLWQLPTNRPALLVQKIPSLYKQAAPLEIVHATWAIAALMGMHASRARLASIKTGRVRAHVLNVRNMHYRQMPQFPNQRVNVLRVTQSMFPRQT